MKFLLVALAAAASAVAHAQVHRCEDSQGRTSYQQTACATVARATPAVDDPGVGDLPLEAASPNDAEIGYPSARRVRAQQEAVTIAARVRQRQEQSNQRDALRRADNRERCIEALRVAELCGKHAGTFYCDAQGFQPVPLTGRTRTAVLDNDSTFRMERCVVEARNSRR